MDLFHAAEHSHCNFAICSCRNCRPHGKEWREHHKRGRKKLKLAIRDELEEYRENILLDKAELTELTEEEYDDPDYVNSLFNDDFTVELIEVVTIR